MQAQQFWTKAYQRNIGKMIGMNFRYVGDRAIAEDLALFSRPLRNRKTTVIWAVLRGG